MHDAVKTQIFIRYNILHSQNAVPRHGSRHDVLNINDDTADFADDRENIATKLGSPEQKVTQVGVKCAIFLLYDVNACAESFDSPLRF